MCDQKTIPKSSKMFINKLNDKIKITKEENKKNLKKIAEKDTDTQGLKIETILSKNLSNFL